MVNEKWTVNFIVSRQKQGVKRFFQSFTIEVDPDEFVLDAIERIWAFHDRSLTFRHACHHSTCGACSMLVNGVEKLTCITPLRSVTRDGGTVRVEPLRNFPVVSDLVVDMSKFYTELEQTRFSQVVPVEDAGLPYEAANEMDQTGTYERLVDCLECGMCISACPIALTSSSYYGPGVLAAAHQMLTQTGDESVLCMADHENGLWRCHSGFECTAVCPSNVAPAWRIMDLRKRVIKNRIQTFFGLKKNKEKSK